MNPAELGDLISKSSPRMLQPGFGSALSGPNLSIFKLLQLHLGKMNPNLEA